MLLMIDATLDDKDATNVDVIPCEVSKNAFFSLP